MTINKLVSAALLAGILTTGCSNKDADTSNQLPEPGAVVAEMSEPIKEDELNEFKYTIKVIADSNVSKGVYKLITEYGPNNTESKFSMPDANTPLIPVIRKGDKPYSHIIGFRLPDDTTFYDYYMVVASDKNTQMHYVKSYSFK